MQDTAWLQLPASMLERFTGLLISNPSPSLLLEETLSGLHDFLGLEALALYGFVGDELLPQAHASRIPLTALGRVGRSAWWAKLEAGIVQHTNEALLGFEALAGYALLILPLSGAHGVVAGALVVARPVSFSQPESQVLLAVARVLAVCLGRYSQYNGQHDSQHNPKPETIALSGLMGLLEHIESQTALRQNALEMLRPHLAGASLCFVQWSAERLRLLEFVGNEGLQALLASSAADDDPLLLEAVLSGSSAFLQELPPNGGRFAQAGVTCVAVLPLSEGMALFAMRRTQVGGWTSAEQRLLSSAGRMMDAALERLHVTQALFEARVRAELLAGLSDALQTTQTAEEVANTAMRLLAPSVYANNIFTLRVVRSPRGISVFGMGAWGTVPSAYAHHFAPEGVLLENTVLSRMVVEQNRAHYENNYLRQKTGEMVGLGIEPIRDSQGRVIALLSVGRDPQNGVWRASERDLLARAAATVGLALERAEVREELLRAKQRAEVLSRLSDALLVAQTGEEVAQFAMQLLAPSLNAENIITLKIERRHNGVYLRSMGVWGELPHLYDGYFRAPGVNIETTRICKQIYQTGEPHYHTAYTDPDLPQLQSRQVSIGLEPIVDSRGRVLAILSVGRAPRTGAWLSSEIKLMAQAAATIGLALERAENRELLEQRASALEEKSQALETKSAEMEAFVYSVSHDLKSPMVSMEGMSQLLAESLAAKQYDELDFFVSRLRANVQTMTALVGGLLELSRVGRIDESMSEVDVGQVIQTVLNELETRLAAKGIVVVRPEVFPSISYSPERLYQIFSNLVGNAVKFSQPLQPSSQLVATAPSQLVVAAPSQLVATAPKLELGFLRTQSMLEFFVRDNGTGIAAHLRGKALELFSRLNPAVEGSGVGLAMVKRIVEHNGGAVRLEDTPGGGLTVVFSVPLERVLEFPESLPTRANPEQ
jgi:signal transduction histidine kinase